MTAFDVVILMLVAFIIFVVGLAIGLLIGMDE